MRTYRTLQEVIHDVILERLKEFKGNVTKTAKSLGVARSTIQRNLSNSEIEGVRYMKKIRRGSFGDIRDD